MFQGRLSTQLAVLQRPARDGCIAKLIEGFPFAPRHAIRGRAQEPTVSDPAIPSNRSPWRATVLTLFPELFPGPLAASLAGDALRQGLWTLDIMAIRDFGLGRHKSVDDTPAGGGARVGIHGV